MTGTKLSRINLPFLRKSLKVVTAECVNCEISESKSNRHNTKTASCGHYITMKTENFSTLSKRD